MTVPRNGNSLLASEVDLIHQLMTGKSVRAIAVVYNRMPQTVTARLRKIMQISGTKNHFQLGVWARDNGYVAAVNTEKTALTTRSNPESLHA